MSNSRTPVSVLHIIAINGIGGAEKLMVTLLPAIQKEGIHCTCLLFYTQPHLAEARSIGKALSEQHVTVIYQAYRHIFQIRNIRFLQSFIKEQNPSILHVHLKHAEFWIAVLKAARKIRQPVVATLHGYRDQYHSRYGLQWNQKARWTPYYWLTRFTASRTGRFIAISNGIAQLFAQAGIVKKESVRVIYHGTTLNDLRLPVRSKAEPDFVVCGRLVGFKGHRYALEAIALLKKNDPQAQLHFYGSGPEEGSLRATAAELGIQANVIFHGFVENLQEQLSAHSIAIVPSTGEPFGLVFFDAFKAGLPVVAFDLPAGNEIIRHGENGLLAKPLSAASLAEQLERLLRDDALYRSVRQTAVSVLHERFAMGQMAEQYAAVYREMSGKNEKS